MIIGIIGGIGSGKTLSMTKFLLEKYNKGWDIFTNYGLKFPQTNKTGIIRKLDKDFFNDYAQSKFDIINSCVAIDEAHVFVDSRRSQSQRNKMFSKFITQSRKRSVDFYYTTQDKSTLHFNLSGQVDIRLRKLTDYVVFCSMYQLNGHSYVINEWYDNAMMFLGRKIWIADKFFGLYDTNEIIDI